MAMNLVATNKKAYRDFFFSQTWEAGIALKGSEVKSVRAGEVNFKGSYATVEKDEVYIYNLHIAPYQQASFMNEDPERKRKLLLHKREIFKIASQIREKRLAFIPTKIYFNAKGLVKVELALGKGKKLYDKREDIKKRTMERGLKRVARERSR